MKNKITLYGLSFGSQFLVTFLITFLSVHYYGTVNSVPLFYNLNTVTFVVTLLSFGIPQALIRFQLIEGVKENELRSTVALVSLCSWLFCFLVIFIIKDLNVAILTLLLPFTFSQYYLRSTEKYREFIILYLLRLVLIIGGAAIIFFFSLRETYWWYFLVGGSYVVSFFYYPPYAGGNFNQNLLKRLLNYAVPLQIYSFLLQGLFLFAQFALEKFGTSNSFQEYVITWRLIQILQAISALIFFFYPQFYFKHILTSSHLIKKSQIYIILGLVVISTGIVLSKPFLDKIFGYSFSYLILILLLISEIFRLSAGVLNTKYSFHMNNKYLLYMLLGCIGIISLFTSFKYFFTGTLGIVDVCVALLICFVLYFFSTWYYSSRINDKDFKV